MPAGASDSFFVEVEDSEALDEKLCEKGIKGRKSWTERTNLQREYPLVS